MPSKSLLEINHKTKAFSLYLSIKSTLKKLYHKGIVQKLFRYYATQPDFKFSYFHTYEII